MRLDQYLVQEGYVETRAKAQDAIQEKRVFVNEKCITKNSFSVNEHDCIRIEHAEVVLASRAGFKLYDVIETFELHLQGRICIDVGASTGGFSDVCLRQGADKVYAVDVGHDQLLASLKRNEKLVNMEGINCRYLTKDMFDPLPNFACMDVSFISIKKILPALFDVLAYKELVVLIKPQFEAGSQHLNKQGIVKDFKVQVQVIRDIIDFVEKQGLYVHHLQASSLLGRDGNKEFVMHIKEEECHKIFDIVSIVKNYEAMR